MATKADFNAEEWSRIVEAPALAALRVAAADRGGTFRESLSLGRAYAEARKRGGSQLMEELVNSAPQIEPAQLKGSDELRAHAMTRLQESLRLVEEKGSAEELEDYRRFILGVAEIVARAHKEGGFLGIGGKEVSEDEQKVLDDLAATLGEPGATAGGSAG